MVRNVLAHIRVRTKRKERTTVELKPEARVLRGPIGRQVSRGSAVQPEAFTDHQRHRLAGGSPSWGRRSLFHCYRSQKTWCWPTLSCGGALHTSTSLIPGMETLWLSPKSDV